MKKILVVFMWVLLVPFTAFAESKEIKPVKIADDVYVYDAGMYLSMFMVTKEGVIVIEPVSSAHSKGMLKAIRSVTDKPIRYLLISHNHWDHANGGQVFRDEGATIVAHVEAYEWMKANPHDDLALPDESWAGLRKDIVLGGRTVELHYMGMNHGLGMTVFRLPKEKIIYVADLVAPKRVLFSIVPDFNIGEWKRTLKEIEALDFGLAVYSHNASGQPTGTKAHVTQTIEYIEDIQSAIMAEFKKGTPFVEIPNAVKLPKYKDWAMYEQWLSLNVWRIMLDGGMGPFPWRPPHAYEGHE